MHKKLYLAILLLCFFIYCSKTDKQNTSEINLKHYCLTRLSLYPQIPPTKDDLRFKMAFEKMKIYYQNLQKPGFGGFDRIITPDFLAEFENILDSSPNYEPALVNLFYP